MKRKCTMLLIMLSIVLCVHHAMSELSPVPIAQLAKLTSSKWQQSYKAYGRTIDVNVELSIPEVDTIPVIKVRKAAPISEPRNSEIEDEYKKADEKDKINTYDYESVDFRTYVEHACPPSWGKNKKENVYKEGRMGSHVFDLLEYDEDKAYADNNPLTVREAVEIAQSHIREFFPDVVTRPNTIWIDGQTFWKKNNKPIQKLGAYVINMVQCFHGVPVMGEIFKAYVNSIYWQINWENYGRGSVVAEIYSDDAWMVHGRLYQETEVICEDIPVLPFDAVKDQIETLIQNGYIRWINSVTLGYVQFESQNPAEQILLPCWVVWCEYHPDGPQSEASYGVNDSDLMFDGNNTYYRPIVINAQTGELFDPKSEERDCCMCPDLSAWK